MEKWSADTIEDALFVGIQGGVFEDILADLPEPLGERFKECYTGLLKLSIQSLILAGTSKASSIGGDVQTYWSELIKIIELGTKYGQDGLLLTFTSCTQRLKAQIWTPSLHTLLDSFGQKICQMQKQ